MPGFVGIARRPCLSFKGARRQAAAFFLFFPGRNGWFESTSAAAVGLVVDEIARPTKYDQRLA
jgi:hypothetical protein